MNGLELNKTINLNQNFILCKNHENKSFSKGNLLDPRNKNGSIYGIKKISASYFTDFYNKNGYLLKSLDGNYIFDNLGKPIAFLKNTNEISYFRYDNMLNLVHIESFLNNKKTWEANLKYIENNEIQLIGKTLEKNGSAVNSFKRIKKYSNNRLKSINNFLWNQKNKEWYICSKEEFVYDIENNELLEKKDYQSIFGSKFKILYFCLIQKETYKYKNGKIIESYIKYDRSSKGYISDEDPVDDLVSYEYHY